MLKTDISRCIHRAAADIATDALLFALLSNPDNNKKLIEERALEILLGNMNVPIEETNQNQCYYNGQLKSLLQTFGSRHDMNRPPDENFASERQTPLHHGVSFGAATKDDDTSVNYDSRQRPPASHVRFTPGLKQNDTFNYLPGKIEMQSKAFQHKLEDFEIQVRGLVCQLDQAGRKEGGDEHHHTRSSDQSLKLLKQLKDEITSELTRVQAEASKVKDLILLQEYQLATLFEKENELSKEKKLLLQQKADFEQERAMLLGAIDSVSGKLVEDASLQRELLTTERNHWWKLSNELELKDLENRRLESELEVLKCQMSQATIHQYEIATSQLAERLNATAHQAHYLTIDVEIEKSKRINAEEEARALRVNAQAAVSRAQDLLTENRLLHEKLGEIKVHAIELMKLKSLKDELHHWKVISDDITTSKQLAHQNDGRCELITFKDTNSARDASAHEISLLPLPEIDTHIDDRKNSIQAIADLLHAIDTAPKEGVGAGSSVLGDVQACNPASAKTSRPEIICSARPARLDIQRRVDR